MLAGESFDFYIHQELIYQRDSKWSTPDWSTSKSQGVKISGPECLSCWSIWVGTMRPNCNDWYLRCGYNLDVNISQTKKKNRTAWTNKGNIDTSATATHNNFPKQEPHQVCIGCGSHQHGTPRTSARHLTCPAWDGVKRATLVENLTIFQQCTGQRKNIPKQW